MEQIAFAEFCPLKFTIYRKLSQFFLISIFLKILFLIEDFVLTFNSILFMKSE